MTILGIDPALRSCALVTLDEGRILRVAFLKVPGPLPRAPGIPAASAWLCARLADVIGQSRPSLIACEGLSLPPGVPAAVRQTAACSAVACAAGAAGVPVVWPAPQLWQRALGVGAKSAELLALGKATAGWELIQARPAAERPHLLDALACAIWAGRGAAGGGNGGIRGESGGFGAEGRTSRGGGPKKSRA